MDLIPKKFFLDEFFNEDVDNMKCDIYKLDDKYHIDIDLPGFLKDNINVYYNNGYLNVSVSDSFSNDNEEKTYIKKERRYQKLQRSFYVGNVSSDEIKASYDNGMLKIVCPFSNDNDTSAKIEIE